MCEIYAYPIIVKNANKIQISNIIINSSEYLILCMLKELYVIPISWEGRKGKTVTRDGGLTLFALTMSTLSVAYPRLLVDRFPGQGTTRSLPQRHPAEQPVNYYPTGGTTRAILRANLRNLLPVAVNDT